MVDFKIVLGAKDGKTYQKEIKSPEADNLLKKRIGETVSGDDLGFSGYEFSITGGSDKCGFPMRKGIQEPRKRIFIGAGVGFSGKKRAFGKKKVRKNQKGLLRRRTVCGEMITKIIHQINLKVTKEGSASLGEAPVEEKKEEPAKK
jgi:small subunit ribosomal protein S6e